MPSDCGIPNRLQNHKDNGNFSLSGLSFCDYLLTRKVGWVAGKQCPTLSTHIIIHKPDIIHEGNFYRSKSTQKIHRE